MILDGWGTRHACIDNAITRANPVNFYSLQEKYPHTLLKCSGRDVGLPHGLMGNSEVGHLNMGSGRIVYQEISRISNAIEDGSFLPTRNYYTPLILPASIKARSILWDCSLTGVCTAIPNIFMLYSTCVKARE